MEMAKAQEIDQAVLEGDTIKYIDNRKDSAEDIANEKEFNRIVKYIEDCKTIVDLQKCKTSCDTDELVEMYNAKEKLLKEQEEKKSNE